MKFNLTEAAKLLGMSRTTLGKRIDAGKIAADIDQDTGWRVVDEEVIDEYNATRYTPYVPYVPHETQPSQPSHATSD